MPGLGSPPPAFPSPGRTHVHERRGRKPTYLNGKGTPLQPGDEVVGGWSREQLEKMDMRFCSRLERAIANGREHAPMLHLTDQQMTLLRQLAAPLAPSQRSAFLQDVARRLHGVELGDGTIAQAAREVQAAIRKALPWLQV